MKKMLSPLWCSVVTRLPSRAVELPPLRPDFNGEGKIPRFGMGGLSISMRVEASSWLGKKKEGYGLVVFFSRKAAELG